MHRIMQRLLLVTLGIVVVGSMSEGRSLQQMQIANAPAANLISAGLFAIQSDPNGTATALADSMPYFSLRSLIGMCQHHIHGGIQLLQSLFYTQLYSRSLLRKYVSRLL